MSIIYDFPSIKSKLRGDDWWEPVKCEAAPEPIEDTRSMILRLNAEFAEEQSGAPA